MVFVMRQKQLQSQIIYVTSQDRKDVVCVIVIFILIKYLALVVRQGLEQNPEIREYGSNYDLLWMCV